MRSRTRAANSSASRWKSGQRLWPVTDSMNASTWSSPGLRFAARQVFCALVMKYVSGGIARSGCASSISRSIVVPERGAPTTNGAGARSAASRLPGRDAFLSFWRSATRRASVGAKLRSRPCSGPRTGRRPRRRGPVRGPACPSSARRDRARHAARHQASPAGRSARRPRPRSQQARRRVASVARRPERAPARADEVEALERRGQLGDLLPVDADRQRHLRVVLEREPPSRRPARPASGSRSPGRRAWKPGAQSALLPDHRDPRGRWTFRPRRRRRRAPTRSRAVRPGCRHPASAALLREGSRSRGPGRPAPPQHVVALACDLLPVRRRSGLVPGGGRDRELLAVQLERSRECRSRAAWPCCQVFGRPRADLGRHVSARAAGSVPRR